MTVTTQYHITGSSVESIATSIEDGVVAGSLPPGTALPSVRGLAKSLGVSPSTAAGAYRELRRRGVVVTHDRSRTVVSHRPPLRTRLRQPVPPGAADLGSGNPDLALMPDLNAGLAELSLVPRRYGEAAALEELTTRARDWFAEDDLHGEIGVVSGTLDGIERVLRVHLRVGDRVAVEDPGYTGMLDLVRAIGLVPVPVAVDPEGPRPDALAEVAPNIAAILLCPRAQNPTGAALSAARVEALSHILDDHPDVLVIEDDHASVVSGSPSRTLTTGRRRWAVVRSLTKLLAPDLRIGLLCGDDETITRVIGLQMLGPGWVSHVLQRLGITLWDMALDADLLETAAATYAERRSSVIGRLADHGIDAWGATGLNIWVPVHEEAPVVAALLQRGWHVMAGEAFRLASAPAIRVTVAELDVEDGVRFADDLTAVLRPDTTTRRG